MVAGLLFPSWRAAASSASRVLPALLLQRTVPAGARGMSNKGFDNVIKTDRRRFVDRLNVTARGGKGGLGGVAYSNGGKFRSALGGNGADGGSVILKACAMVRCLRGVKQVLTAQAGGPGRDKRQRGRVGADIVVSVPVGTVVRRRVDPEEEAEFQEIELLEGARPKADFWKQFEDLSDEELMQSAKRSGEEYEVLRDLNRPGDTLVVAKGGNGGRGNASFRVKANRPASSESTPGTPGETVDLQLELKTIAEVGLVGFPNAGKSTLVNALSNCGSVVGAYAFTTLRPQLGTMILRPEEIGPDVHEGRHVTIADIPGLIEGAADNRGLGHNFLRHVERTVVLAYIVDITAGLQGCKQPRPWEQLEKLRAELEKYKPDLPNKPSILIANKMDKSKMTKRTLAALEKKCDLPVVAISAMHGEGIDDLRRVLAEYTTPLESEDEEDEEDEEWEELPLEEDEWEELRWEEEEEEEGGGKKGRGGKRARVEVDLYESDSDYDSDNDEGGRRR